MSTIWEWLSLDLKAVRPTSFLPHSPGFAVKGHFPVVISACRLRWVWKFDPGLLKSPVLAEPSQTVPILVVPHPSDVDVWGRLVHMEGHRQDMHMSTVDPVPLVQTL